MENGIQKQFVCPKPSAAEVWTVKEMDHPARGKALSGRDRQGCRKGARLSVRDAKDACCVELDPQNAGHATQGLSILPRADLKDGVVIFEPGLLSDVQAGMGIEDLQAGEHQEEQADRPDPMGDAGQQALAIDKWSAWHGRCPFPHA